MASTRAPTGLNCTNSPTRSAPQQLRTRHVVNLAPHPADPMTHSWRTAAPITRPPPCPRPQYPDPPWPVILFAPHSSPAPLSQASSVQFLHCADVW